MIQKVFFSLFLLLISLYFLTGLVDLISVPHWCIAPNYQKLLLNCAETEEFSVKVYWRQISIV